MSVSAQKLILIDVADTKAPGPDAATAADTEEAREQKAAPGGAADSGVGGGQRMANGVAVSHDADGQHSAGAAAPAPHPRTAGSTSEDGSGGGYNPNLASAHNAARTQQAQGSGVAADTNVQGTGGGEMQDNLPAHSSTAAGRANGSPPGGSSQQQTDNSRATEGQLGGAIDDIGDTAPGTGHRAGHGAETGPTKGRGQRRLVAFLGGIDVCSGV